MSLRQLTLRSRVGYKQIQQMFASAITNKKFVYFQEEVGELPFKTTCAHCDFISEQPDTITTGLYLEGL